MIQMVQFDELTSGVVVDTSTQRKRRCSTLGGVSIGKSTVAIESGDSPEIGKSMRCALETHFDLPVSHMFLTHTHPDHRKGMSAFKDITLVISTKCYEDIPRSVKLGKWNVETFDDMLILGESNQLELQHVGGHTIGSSVALVPKDKVLFVGDLIFERSANFGLPFMGFYQNRPKSDGNPAEHIAAFEKFKRMKVKIIVPGHGDVIHDADKHLDVQIKFFKELHEFIISEIEDGKSIDAIDLPDIGLIKQAYSVLETHKEKSTAKRWLESYLQKLKVSFYRYYSTDQSI